MTEVIEVTLVYFHIAFVGQSLVWCLHQAAEDMEANSFCFFRLESPVLTPAPKSCKYLKITSEKLAPCTVQTSMNVRSIQAA